jgi:hypothetical protein
MVYLYLSKREKATSLNKKETVSTKHAPPAAIQTPKASYVANNALMAINAPTIVAVVRNHFFAML